MADFFLQGQLTDASSVARRDLARTVPGMAHFAGVGRPASSAPSARIGNVRHRTGNTSAESSNS